MYTKFGCVSCSKLLKRANKYRNLVASHIMSFKFQNKYMGSVPSSYGDILTMKNKIMLFERSSECILISNVM